MEKLDFGAKNWQSVKWCKIKTLLILSAYIKLHLSFICYQNWWPWVSICGHLLF